MEQISYFLIICTYKHFSNCKVPWACKLSQNCRIERKRLGCAVPPGKSVYHCSNNTLTIGVHFKVLPDIIFQKHNLTKRVFLSPYTKTRWQPSPPPPVQATPIVSHKLRHTYWDVTYYNSGEVLEALHCENEI